MRFSILITLAMSSMALAASHGAICAAAQKQADAALAKLTDPEPGTTLVSTGEVNCIATSQGTAACNDNLGANC